MTGQNISRKISGIVNRFEKEKNFWLNQLSGSPLDCRFPFSGPHILAGKISKDKNSEEEQGKPDNQASLGSIEFAVTGKGLTTLMDLSQGNDYKLHVILEAAAAVLLHKYTGNNDIVMGIPI